MIIDAHAHVYPDKIAERASNGIADFYGMPVRYDGRVETLLKLGEAAGIDAHLICSVALLPGTVGPINQFIADTVSAHPGRFIGFAALHPESADLAGDIERALAMGLRGVKLHSDFQRFALNSPQSFRIFEALGGRVPVLIHTGDARFDFSHPSQAARLLKAFPETTVIGAHLGGWSEWDEAVELLSGLDNFYVDTCSSLYELPPERAARIIRQYGADRVLFGVDFPMWNPATELAWLRGLGLTDGELDKILSGNAARLLGI